MGAFRIFAGVAALGLVAAAIWVMQPGPTNEDRASVTKTSATATATAVPENRSAAALATAQARASAKKWRAEAGGFAPDSLRRRGAALGRIGALPRTLPRRATPESFESPEAAERWYEGELTAARIRRDRLGLLADRMHDEGAASEVILERVALEVNDAEAYVAELKRGLEALTRPVPASPGDIETTPALSAP